MLRIFSQTWNRSLLNKFHALTVPIEATGFYQDATMYKVTKLEGLRRCAFPVHTVVYPIVIAWLNKHTLPAKTAPLYGYKGSTGKKHMGTRKAVRKVYK